uniref:Movement protein TGBp3 n=1 Tax=Carlavirus americanense TaxID=1177630 RepID=I1W5U1_9VIRU|nr:triple gene block protein 3 [American hop latent virus]
MSFLQSQSLIVCMCFFIGFLLVYPFIGQQSVEQCQLLVNGESVKLLNCALSPELVEAVGKLKPLRF